MASQDPVSDFEELSRHDDTIYGLRFDVGDSFQGDWHADPVLDIDHIVTWVRGEAGKFQFRVAPATLVFHGVTDLKIAIDWGDSGDRTALNEASIAGITREPVTDQKGYPVRAHYRWRIVLNWPEGGEIGFGARGFTQTLRAEPVLLDQQRLPAGPRGQGGGMRPGVRDFSTAYDRPPPPSEIRQEPLDGDPGHYARLSALEDGALPRPRDFGDYADDICYMETVQAELFAHLLPACLEAWRHDLTHDHRSDYAGNVEIFQSALARRPLLEACLTPARAAAVLAYMRDTLLDRIDREDHLSHAGQDATAYAWFYRLGSFAMIFPELEPLWRECWRFETPGQAVAALQYTSCLMYEDRDNPIFAPWTRQDGGGTPGLWETDGQIFHEHWRMENVMFLMETVTWDYLHDALGRARGVLAGVLDSEVPARMLAGFSAQRPLLEHRLRVLPNLLSQPLDAILEWPEMG